VMIAGCMLAAVSIAAVLLPICDCLLQLAASIVTSNRGKYW